MTSHAHHRVIDEPMGATSRGRCKICGAERAFGNIYYLDALPPTGQRHAVHRPGPRLKFNQTLKARDKA